MAKLEISTDQMERERVARFSELDPNPMMFVDTRLPEHARDLFSIIGPGVSEDPSTQPSITAGHGFNIAYVGAEPGCGAALPFVPRSEPPPVRERVGKPAVEPLAQALSEADERLQKRIMKVLDRMGYKRK